MSNSDLSELQRLLDGLAYPAFVTDAAGRTLLCNRAATEAQGGGGQIVGVPVIFWDVTTEKLAQEALRASEMRYRTLYDSSRDAIMVLKPETGFLNGNPDRKSVV